MKTTYGGAVEAIRAMKELMGAKGLNGRTQVKMVRLWNALAEHNRTAAEADRMLAEEYGAIGKNGVIDFTDEEKKMHVLREREEMLSTEIEIEPIEIVASDAFFAASSPDVLVALEGFISIKEEK